MNKYSLDSLDLNFQLYIKLYIKFDKIYLVQNDYKIINN